MKIYFKKSKNLYITAAIVALLLITVSAAMVMLCTKDEKDAAAGEDLVIELDPSAPLPEVTADKDITSETSKAITDILSENEVTPEPREQEVSPSPTATPMIPDSSEGNTPIVSDTGLLAGMAAGTILPPGTVTLDNYTGYFYYMPVPSEVYDSMLGKSYVVNDDISIDNLRYVRVIHYNFNHEIQVGELIVNSAIAEDAIGIFRELYENEYEIQSMFLVDRYWTGDGETTDSASIDVNNTSCFLYRKATGSSKLSKHAYGMAIDINPQQNPYVSYKTGSPVWSHSNADAYIDRTTGLPHVITEGDVCYNIFAKYGFSWGGNWKTTKDYQHFQK